MASMGWGLASVIRMHPGFTYVPQTTQHTAITISYADRSNLATSILKMAEDLHWRVCIHKYVYVYMYIQPGLRPFTHTSLPPLASTKTQVSPRARAGPLLLLRWVRHHGGHWRLLKRSLWGQSHPPGAKIYLHVCLHREANDTTTTPPIHARIRRPASSYGPSSPSLRPLPPRRGWPPPSPRAFCLARERGSPSPLCIP